MLVAAQVPPVPLRQFTRWSPLPVPSRAARTGRARWQRYAAVAVLAAAAAAGGLTGPGDTPSPEPAVAPAATSTR